MKVFLDTSVLVAAFATRGLCADVLRTVLAEHELVVSETVLAELVRVLGEKLGMPEAEARSVGRFVQQQASLADEEQPAPARVRDETDASILAAAVSGGCAVLVTGDQDLLVLDPVGSLRIVNPRGFWEMVRKRR